MTAVLSTIGTTILGSVATKTFDSLVTSKFAQKNDKNKWLREKKLNLFSELSNEVLTINCENLEKKQKNIKNLTSKINILSNDKKLQKKLENYSFILDEYECFKSEINLEQLNYELVDTLKLHMIKI